jgi:hypothetical protein
MERLVLYALREPVADPFGHAVGLLLDYMTEKDCRVSRGWCEWFVNLVMDTEHEHDPKDKGN